MRTDLRELLAVVLDALPQAAMVVRRDGGVLLRNAAAEAMLPEGECVDSVFCDGEAVEIHWQTEMVELADGAGRLVRRNIRLTGRSSRQLVVDVHFRGMSRCLALCEEAGRGSGVQAARCVVPAEALRGAPAAGQGCVLVLVEDVSARVSMERRLRAGERLAATGMVAAKVAHELNNPLDGVLRFVGLAERVAGPEAARYLASARTGLLRMAETIRGLLERGRARGGGDRVAVQRLLDEAIEVMRPRAHALGVSIVCDFDDRVEGVVEGAAFQVFCNVIKNAVDAMPGGGMLTVLLRPVEGQCEIEFADTGCGLTEEEAERIFEAFYTTKPPAEGSGLGLTICREIVTRLGGSIGARPRAEGGAAVTVRLPVHPAWKPSQ